MACNKMRNLHLCMWSCALYFIIQRTSEYEKIGNKRYFYVLYVTCSQPNFFIIQKLLVYIRHRLVAIHLKPNIINIVPSRSEDYSLYLRKSQAEKQDFYLADSETGTPTNSALGSPAQRLMGRRTKTLLPTTHRLLLPKLISSCTMTSKEYSGLYLFTPLLYGWTVSFAMATAVMNGGDSP